MSTSELVEDIKDEYGDVFPPLVWEFIIEHGEEIAESALEGDERIAVVGWAFACQVMSALSKGEGFEPLQTMVQVIYSLAHAMWYHYHVKGREEAAEVFNQLQELIEGWAEENNFVPLYRLSDP